MYVIINAVPGGGGRGDKGTGRRRIRGQRLTEIKGEGASGMVAVRVVEDVD